MTRLQNDSRQTMPSRSVSLFSLFFVVALMAGCGSQNAGVPSLPLSLSPATATLGIGDHLHMTAGGSLGQAPCAWAISNESVLFPVVEGTFQAKGAGTTEVSVNCGGATAHAEVVVKSQTAAPLVITQGGVYSGQWISDDPSTPAVQIQTTQPVTLRNATISGRGDLISVPRSGTGANVTVENVTGVGLDPGVSGLQRGNFIAADGVASLVVKNCTMSGVRFGVKVLSSQATKLSITRNLAKNLEDRESDGQGGFLVDRPDLGHFVMLNGVSVPNGAEIAWNQVNNTIGSSSTEDVFNIYKSQGAPNFPIAVHDNYMEGNSSPSRPDNYTGSGLITDGDSVEPETAFVKFARNQVVHTAGSGVEIAGGHDIVVSDNRVVSCGIDASGRWYAAPFVNAVVVWNDYAEPNFKNISVHGTVGGMLRPNSDGSVMVADLWARTEDLDASDVIGANAFTDPCLKGGTLNLSAEDDERTFWQTKLANAGVVVGNQNVAP